MKELQFSLSIAETNLILKGLGKLPFENSNQVINKLQVQAAKQLEPVEDPKPEDKA